MPPTDALDLWHAALLYKIVIVSGHYGLDRYGPDDHEMMFSHRQYHHLDWEVERELPREFDNSCVACQLEVTGFNGMPTFRVLRTQKAPTPEEAIRLLVQSIEGVR